jgi:phosphohistidine phosphatase
MTLRSVPHASAYVAGVAFHALFLLRHAKSSWSDGRLDDHDRPLASRGEDAVERVRRHLAAAGIAPALVLCSSARRTVMTLEGVAPAFPATTTVLVEPGLYAASSRRLLSRLHDVDEGVGSVMVIAHNPGLEQLVQVLAGSGDEELRRRAAAKFPTGALAELSFEGPWADLDAGGARLASFVVPRELP